MNWKKEAIKIMKKFASGVDCPKWDENSIKNTMFHPQCKKIAEKLKKKEIDEKVAKEYILKKHNPNTVKNGKKLNFPTDKIIECMVLPKKVGDGWICIHGKADLFSITQEEAELLEKEIQGLLKGLQ